MASAVKKFKIASRVKHPPSRRRSASGKIQSARFAEPSSCRDGQLVRQLDFQGSFDSPTQSETNEIVTPAAQPIDEVVHFVQTVKTSRDFASAFEYVCENIPILRNTWIWISEAGRIVKENGREGLNIDPSNLKKSLPKDVTPNQLSGGSARRVKTYSHRVENKIRTFLYFDLDADEFKCYDEPTYDVMKQALHKKFLMYDILHPTLFERRNSWNHGLARSLFPPVIRPVFDEDLRIVDEMQEEQSPFDSARQARDLLQKASLDIAELKKLIYKWEDFQRDQHGDDEVDRMLERYQRKCAILSLAISLVLETDAIERKIYYRWDFCVSEALKMWNRVGMDKYKVNRSEKTIKDAWVLFREYHLFPNTVEDRLRAGPPLLRHNPELRSVMKKWGNQNLRILNPATFRDYLLDEALPAFVEVLRIEALDAEAQGLPPRLPQKMTAELLTVDGLLKAYNCKTLAVSTIINWMDYVG